MRIVSHKRLKDSFEGPGNEDSKVALENWYHHVLKSEWKNFSDIRVNFPSADYVGNQHYVFNIKWDKYRLVVVIKFVMGYLFTFPALTLKTKIIAAKQLLSYIKQQLSFESFFFKPVVYPSNPTSNHNRGSLHILANFYKTCPPYTKRGVFVYGQSFLGAPVNKKECFCVRGGGFASERGGYV